MLREASKSGAIVQMLRLDVSDSSYIPTFVKGVREQIAGLDVLVNNAAVRRRASFGRSTAGSDHHRRRRAQIYLDEWTEEAFGSTLRTNTWGALDLAVALRAALPEGVNHVVNVSSGYGKLEYCSPPYREAISSASTVAELKAAVNFDADDARMSRAVSLAACVGWGGL